MAQLLNKFIQLSEFSTNFTTNLNLVEQFCEKLTSNEIKEISESFTEDQVKNEMILLFILKSFHLISVHSKQLMQSHIHELIMSREFFPLSVFLQKICSVLKVDDMSAFFNELSITSNLFGFAARLLQNDHYFERCFLMCIYNEQNLSYEKWRQLMKSEIFDGDAGKDILSHVIPLLPIQYPPCKEVHCDPFLWQVIHDDAVSQFSMKRKYAMCSIYKLIKWIFDNKTCFKVNY